MKEIKNLKSTTQALIIRSSGTVFGYVGQKTAEWLAKTRVNDEISMLNWLSEVTDSSIDYLKLAIDIGDERLMNAMEVFNRIALPNDLNPTSIAAGFLLAGASLMADYKNGDWIGDYFDKIKRGDNDKLANVLKSGAWLVQMSMAGAIALTPAIITKMMETELIMGANWETGVAILGVLSLAASLVPAGVDALKAGKQAYDRGDSGVKVVWEAAKGAVRRKD